MAMKMDFEDALAKAKRWLDTIDGVKGVGEGQFEGERCISVFVTDREVAKKLPDQLGGHRVSIVVIGGIRALSL